MYKNLHMHPVPFMFIDVHSIVQVVLNTDYNAAGTLTRVFFIHCGCTNDKFMLLKKQTELCIHVGLHVHAHSNSKLWYMYMYI